MERLKYFSRVVVTEENTACQLDYILHSAEDGSSYGIEILMTDAQGKEEKELVGGICESQEEALEFLKRLADGLALPIELTVLCDDYISEKEHTVKQKMEQAAS